MAAGILPEPIDAEHVLEVGRRRRRLTALARRALLRELAACAAYTSGVARSATFRRSTALLARRRASPTCRTRSRSRPRASALERARDGDPGGRRSGRPRRGRRSRSSPRLRRPSLRRVLNATGVLVHTNLGRAPLAPAALERVVEVGGGYSNLEYDLERARAARARITSPRCCTRLTGAEAALVVNNNAAAVMLALAALAEGREVLVSRGELIEIGDGFRIPDVLARSGARLVEVGTTNRTRAADYERAIGPETAAAPARPPVELPRRRVHGAARSSPSWPRSRRRTGLPLVDDLGSGALARDRRRADRRRRASRPAPTSSASPATSSSAARRRASSSAAPTSSSGCAGIRCSARCAPTS